MPKTKRPRSSAGPSAASSAAPYSLAARAAAHSSSSSTQNDAPRPAASSNLIAPNTSLGQHFLKNPAVVTAIVAKAAIKPTDSVLEIGPGTSTLLL